MSDTDLLITPSEALIIIEADAGEVPIMVPVGEPGPAGADGADGVAGAAGPGLPAGGSIGQLAVKSGAGDYAVEWRDPTTLPISTATQTALDGKAVTGHAHAIADVTGLQGALDGKEAAGVAAGLVSTHAAAVDPHPQYHTNARGDARYDAIGAAVAAQAAAIQRANHTGSQAIGTVTGLQAALDAKATPALVDDRIAAVVGAAPAALDTLKEIADQLAIDENAVAALTTVVAGKEAVGVAATLGAAHVAAADPHPQYQQAAGVNALIAAAVGTVTQAYHATLGLLAAVATTAFGRDFLALADAAAGRVKLGLANVAATGSYADLTGTPAAYSLPVATSAVLGGVKSSASIAVAGDGTLGVGATVTGPTGSLLTIASATGQDMTLAPANGTLTISNASVNLSSYFRSYRINSDLFIGRYAAGAMQLGLDAAAPVAQAITAANARAFTDTNAVGGNLTISSGRGTGSAASSTLTLATPEPTTSGTGGQVSTPRITIKGNSVGIGSSVTTPSTTLHVGGPIRCAAYTVATVPSASSVGNGAHIYVTNPAAGVARPYWSNSTEWRDAAGTLLA